MPITVLHQLTATTPDNTSYEIRPSHWNSSHSASISLVGSEAIGAFSNSNGVSFGTTPDGHITVTVATNQSNQTIGLTALGNTTINNNSTIDARSLGISGAGNVSVGIIGSNIVISGSGGGGNLAVAAGTNVLTSGTAAFGNANNVSFGMDTAGNVTASASYQSGVNFSASNAAANLSSIVFGNANGASFGLVGSTLTLSYTQPNTAGLISNINVSASNASANLSALVLGNANGVSFGMNAGTVTASVVQSNQTEGMFAIGNTTQGSSGTFDARSMSVVGAGNVSVGFTNGSMVISAVGTAPAGGVALSAGTQSTNTGTVIFSNSNGVSFGLNNGTLTATVNPGPAAGMAAIGAGTQTQTTGTMVFQNANGISFGMSNSSQITAIYTVPTQSIQPVAVSGSNGSFAFSTLSLGALNGATFYTTNGSVAMSYTVPSTAGHLSAINVSAGTQASNLSALTFANTNNVSFGLSAGTITGSALINVSAGTVAAGYSAITLANSNNVSFGLNNGTITGSASFAAQTVQTVGMYARGSTTGASSSSTYDARSISISGIGNIYVGNSGGAFVIQDTASGGGANTFSAFAVSNTTQSSTGTIAASAMSFAGAGAVSVGVSNGSIVISAAAGAQSVQTLGIYGGSNTTGTSSSTYDARFVTFAGAGIISVGNSNGSVIISGPATTNVNLLSVGMSTGGNTTGTTGMAASQLVLAGGNNITLSGSTNAGGSMTISIVGGAGGGVNSFSAFAVSNTTQGSSGTVAASAMSFQGAGMVSVGMSNGSIIISGPGTSGISQSLYAASNTTQGSSGTSPIGSIVLAGAGNVSVGVSNGSYVISGAGGSGGGGVNFGVSTAGNTAGATGTVSTGNVVLVGSGPISLSQATGAAGSAATITINGPAISSISGTGAVSVAINASTISIGVPIVSMGVSGGNTSNASGTVSNQIVFAGGNNITLSGSTNAGGMSVTISGANAGGAQTAISGIVVSNTTYTSGTVSFSNANGISFGSSAGQAITASYTQSAQAVSAAGGSSAFQTLAFTNSNNVSFSNTGGSIWGSYALNVSAPGGTSNALSGITFSNSNGVSFGLSTGAGVGTMTASVAAQTNQTVGLYALGNTTQNSSTTLDARTISYNGLGAMTVGFSAGSVQISGPAISSISGTGLVSVALNASTISIGVAGTTKSVWKPEYWGSEGAAQLGNGTIQVFPAFCNSPFSASRGDAYISVSMSTSSNSSFALTLSMAIGMYTRNGSTLSLASSGSQSYAITNTSNNSTGSLSGIRNVSVPININAAPADYWIAVLSQTASANVAWLTASNIVFSNQAASYQGPFGASSVSTNQSMLGFGQYTATSVALPSSMALSNIIGTGNNMAPALIFHNVTA